MSPRGNAARPGPHRPQHPTSPNPADRPRRPNPAPAATPVAQHSPRRARSIGRLGLLHPTGPTGLAEPARTTGPSTSQERRPRHRCAPRQDRHQQIERSLGTLARKAQAEFLDAGLWVLYVGLGFLRWKDGNDEVSSPLYLLPVRLEQRPGHRAWRLVGSDDGEPALNPSLAVRLERDGIVLPALDELEDDSYPTAMAAVRHAVDGAGWRVDETAVLSTFTFQKEVIYRDLRVNEDTIAAHAMVRLLAEGPTSSQLETMAFAPEPEEGLDDRHPPEDLACILDADATQRRCLIAARQGHSFVMDGPPGTGKSQTIANVIAQLLRDGKTVLFVSEKAAALEVVQDRLTDVGLDPFILALHSHRATRKAVAKELGDALAESPRATSRFDAVDRARIERERRQLTDYAVAVNEVRQPCPTEPPRRDGRDLQAQQLPPDSSARCGHDRHRRH